MDRAELLRVLERDAAVEGSEIVGIAFPSPEADAALTFENVRFEAVDFMAAELAGARFVDCRLERCDLSRTLLTEAHFRGTSLYDHDRSSGCVLHHADLEAATFERCDLSMCDLHRARAWNLTLEDCVAQGITLDGTSFSRHPSRHLTLTAFSAHRCNLSFAEMTNLHLQGATLTECRLREAVMADVDLSDADLSGCDLSGIDARRCVLAGADLRDATIDGLDPTRIDLTGIRIRAWQQSALLEAMGIRVDP